MWESLLLFGDFVLNMVKRVWSGREETTGSDGWEDVKLCGRVGKVWLTVKNLLKRTTVIIFTRKDGECSQE